MSDFGNKVDHSFSWSCSRILQLSSMDIHFKCWEWLDVLLRINLILSRCINISNDNTWVYFFKLGRNLLIFFCKLYTVPTSWRIIFDEDKVVVFNRLVIIFIGQTYNIQRCESCLCFSFWVNWTVYLISLCIFKKLI